MQVIEENGGGYESQVYDKMEGLIDKYMKQSKDDPDFEEKMKVIDEINAEPKQQID